MSNQIIHHRMDTGLAMRNIAQISVVLIISESRQDMRFVIHEAHIKQLARKK